MRTSLAVTLLCICCAASVPARGETVPVPRPTSWEIRDIEHPLLGPIKVAVPKAGAITEVGSLKVVSAAFVSCQKRTGKITIELANSVESDTQGGLKPQEMPRLVCKGMTDKAFVNAEFAATWETNELGDAMARGLSPSALRRCATIEVTQNVILPAGAPAKTQRMTMEVDPLNRDLDPVFGACGEKVQVAAATPAPAAKARPAAATAPAPAATPATAPASPTAPPAKGAPATAAAEAPWKPAHTATGSRTNVRSAPSTAAGVVIRLDSGAKLLAQQVAPQWWRVKPRTGAGFSGYIREDRLAFE